MRLEQRGDVGELEIREGPVAADERKLEAQLVDSIGSADVAQPDAVHRRPERRLRWR